MDKRILGWRASFLVLALASYSLNNANAQSDTEAMDCDDRPFCIGTVTDAATIAPWNIDVLPDGTGLPEGQGDVASGAEVYKTGCAYCHGEDGLGGIKPIEDHAGYPALSSTDPTPLSAIDSWPTKNVGTYLPYATTLFDYIRRSMPFVNSQSLSDDEIYSLVAYLLSINKVIPENSVLDKASLSAIQMPNRDGFTCDSRPDTHNEPCMGDCAVPGDDGFDLGVAAKPGDDSQEDCMVVQ
ncbi:c-type cytochrome [Granulosicoccus antarcticus]|uniref:Thiosulfate dehydrogenase n=1 Tax=Granulosicoccus antarcticus IMCC3135 TaxID=1192854 RepID=A0A2Z2NRH8_9GAMM|nr:cytochrome c [Granulosicoccus antarcticus]ASJ73953.1 Thiosulfate dehydrogenase [Granulosicoccus antarcticus IMCC3135]